MLKTVEIDLLPERAYDDQAIVAKCSEALLGKEIKGFRVIRRSIDARKQPVKYRLRVEIHDQKVSQREFSVDRKQAQNGSVAIIGAGPAGLFAALRLLENGVKPVIFERGKDVRGRRRDLAAIHKEHKVDPHSNYCFGEGGAGTYSDGKLYTRSKKRGDVRKVLEILVEHGASENILEDARPHIGTNKLPDLITKIRETILELGGEVRFENFVDDILIEENKVVGLSVNGEAQPFNQVILATGHSARDIYYMLDSKGVALEFKNFALGVRVEHPQSLIDGRQYHCDIRPEFLPPAAYSLVSQVDGKGVFSFCMCPGGIIAPCATEEKEVVTNGWSPSKRNNPYANSGIVTQVEWDDISEFHSFEAMAGLHFQKSVERRCWEAGGMTQAAPAQRLEDFVAGNPSSTLPVCSYGPGVVPARVDQLLPKFVSKRLQQAFRDFDRKIKGFIHPDAIVVAPESRTSSPIKIPRHKESLQHPEVLGLYPCGEGAGFAGGIVSAAMDGQKIAAKCVEQVAAK